MGQTGREDMIRKLLDVPEKFRPIAVMPIDVPDENPPSKERKRIGEVVSWGKLGKSQGIGN